MTRRAGLRWPRALPIGLILAAAMLGSGRAAAQGDSLEMTKRRELEAIQRQARETREAAKRLKSQETSEIGKLRRTERDLGSTQRRLRKLDRRQGELDQELRITRVNLEHSLSALERQRNLLARRLRNLYKMGPGAEIELLLSTHSFAELLARWDFLVRIAQQDRAMLDNLDRRRSDVSDNEQRLSLTLGQVGKNLTATEREKLRLARMRSERQHTVGRIQTQRKAYEAAATELERTARSIQRLLAQLERQRKAEEAEGGRQPVPYAGDFARGQGALDWPVRGELVGRFGPEEHPRFGTKTLNNGVDIKSEIGTAVRSVAKGRVEFTNEDYGTYGQIVILNHGGGYYTLYAHLSEIVVRVGQEVASGVTVGRVGDTGSLKGSILHFEVRRGATALNPEDWLR